MSVSEQHSIYKILSLNYRNVVRYSQIVRTLPQTIVRRPKALKIDVSDYPTVVTPIFGEPPRLNQAFCQKRESLDIHLRR